MRTQLAWLCLPACLLLGTLALAAEKPGGIAGVVRYTGTVPEPESILTTEGGTLLHNDLVVDPKTQLLKGASIREAPFQGR